MMRTRLPMRTTAFVQILAMLFMACLPVLASASMIDTGSAVADQQLTHDRESLKAMLDKGEVRDTLERMGVSKEMAEERINNLTQQELAEFNEQLAQAPAGEGVLGVVVLLFIVFIVTDVIGATDIFPFVRSVN